MCVFVSLDDDTYFLDICDRKTNVLRDCEEKTYSSTFELLLLSIVVIYEILKGSKTKQILRKIQKLKITNLSS